MHMLDLAAYTGPLLIVALLAVVALLVSLRDQEHAAPRLVSRTVWCPRHKRMAVVEFNERVQTGMAFRSAHNCPLRKPGEKCGEGCAVQATQWP